MARFTTLRDTITHPSEGRLRSPIRILGGGFVLLATLLLVQLGALLIGGTRFDPGSPMGFGVLMILGGLVVIVALLPIARYLDRRQITDYGLRIDRDWWIDCAFGMFLGVALQTSIFVVGWAAGWFTIVGTFQAPGSLLVWFGGLILLFLVVGVYEELLIRGWLLTNLAEGLRVVGTGPAVLVAVAVSSGLFGLLHATNPGATPLSIVVISLAGVLLAAGYVFTGELAIPIGLHVTWNLAQGGLFGHGVSGLDVTVTVIATASTGPTRWTGGEFGPEGGLLGLFAVIIGYLAVAGWVRYRSGSLGIHPAVTTPDLRGQSGTGTDQSNAEPDRAETMENTSDSDEGATPEQDF